MKFLSTEASTAAAPDSNTEQRRSAEEYRHAHEWGWQNLKPDNFLNPLAALTASGIGTRANKRLQMTHGWATKAENVLNNGGSHLVLSGHQAQCQCERA